MYFWDAGEYGAHMRRAEELRSLLTSKHRKKVSAKGEGPLDVCQVVAFSTVGMSGSRRGALVREASAPRCGRH